ncbi:MAG: NADH:ubiquinone oxidoreductase subunit NDUFA12 [Aestuariivita sp.]|nr:NADH:ubiquinone oxidoreductase subunit NDUFA12 [Aestuariivita sp.]
MGILNAISRALTWWNGQTLNTQFYTWRKGVKVGEDEQGNIYYRTKNDQRRWVIFKGEAEASRISPDWHGWLHRTWDTTPNKRPLIHKEWEKPHRKNLTGTDRAYAPSGSIRKQVPEARKDYEAWNPEK